MNNNLKDISKLVLEKFNNKEDLNDLILEIKNNYLIDFIVYNFKYLPNTYLTKLFIDYKNIWEDLSYSDLIYILNQIDDNEIAIISFLSVTYKVIGVDLLTIYKNGTNFNNTVKLKIQNLLDSKSILYRYIKVDYRHYGEKYLHDDTFFKIRERLKEQGANLTNLERDDTI